MSEVDWLSHLLQIVTVTGQLEVRCAYGAPWRVAWSRAAANEIPYHVIVKGRAIFEDPETRTAKELWGSRFKPGRSNNGSTGAHDLLVVIRCKAELPLVTAAADSLRSNVASWPPRALASASR